MALSLKLLRRNPDRPSLRDRAAALKAAAAKVIRRPKPEEATGTAPVEAWVCLDTTLLSQVRELVAIEAEQTTILEAGSYADAYDAPDWVRLERTREAVLAQVIATRAHTMEGLKAKARLFDLESVANLQESHERLALSIVADVTAIDAVPRPERRAASEAVGHVDPMLAALERHRRAHEAFGEAVTAADPVAIEQAGGDTSPGALALLDDREQVADDADEVAWREIFTVQPTTVGGYVALLRHLGRYWQSFEGMDDEPDVLGALARMVQELKLSSVGSSPLSTPVSDLAQACIGLVERRTWIDQGDNARTVGDGDDAWTVELNRQSIVFRRAIEEPSVDAADLAAKARLMLDDVDRFHPEGETTTDDERLMRVILREVVALVGGSSPDTADATNDGAPVIARADEAPAASLPIPDLSDCSALQLARLYEAFHAAYDHLSALGQLSCFWESGVSATRERFNPAGHIVDREADRLARLYDACAEEIARRKPRSERDADEILTTRLMHELACNGRVHDPVLMRDIARTWAA